MGEKQLKPTERAQLQFHDGANKAFAGKMGKGLSPTDDAYVLHRIAGGLEEIAIGLRATYILLEEVKELVKRQTKP